MKMERNFYAENFEKFLKGHVDNFRMTPSKKVWHGIYNDVHPGKRWPSIAMSMVFIFTLVIIGHLNTNNSRTPLSYLTSGDKLSQALKPVKKQAVLTSSYKQNIFINKIADIASLIILNVDEQPAAETTKHSSLYSNTSNNDNESTQSTSSLENNNKIITASFNTEQPEPSSLKTYVVYDNAAVTEEDASSSNIEAVTDHNNSNVAANIKINKKNNVTWSYYASPLISYRHFNGSSSQLNNFTTHKPIIGIEAGTSMSFKISNQLQAISGVQVNYSGYNIKASNSHPVLATLMLNSSTPGIMVPHTGVSSFSNGTGYNTAKLNNYSVYASIPIGVQYTFGVGENIQLNAAATLQPTFLIAGKAYLLSTDKKNYLSENTLLRKWNMGTNFGTFVSFRASSYNWQIGPQINYQIFSNYTNKSPYNEHLINYGIRFGVSKSK